MRSVGFLSNYYGVDYIPVPVHTALHDVRAKESSLNAQFGTHGVF